MTMTSDAIAGVAAQHGQARAGQYLPEPDRAVPRVVARSRKTQRNHTETVRGERHINPPKCTITPRHLSHRNLHQDYCLLICNKTTYTSLKARHQWGPSEPNLLDRIKWERSVWDYRQVTFM